MAIIDTLTTITEVCSLQGHDMNTLADAAAGRLFSDSKIEATINNVIRFVYANSDSNLTEYAKLFVVNTISVMALNNVMKEAGYLPEWDLVDPYNKDAFKRMIETKQETPDQVDVIPMFRGQFHEW